MKTSLFRMTISLAILGLAGCNTLTGDALDTLRLAYSGPQPAVTAEQVQAAERPVLLVEFGVADAMLVSPSQASSPGEPVEWHGITEMLLTQGGRLVQTAGLPADIIAPLPNNDPFLLGLHTLADGTRITRLVDYPARYLTGLHQHAHYRIGRLEPIRFMGREHQLLRIDEHIRMPELGFKATNHFWIEADTGLVRYSVQHLAPDLPPLHLTLARTRGLAQP